MGCRQQCWEVLRGWQSGSYGHDILAANAHPRIRNISHRRRALLCWHVGQRSRCQRHSKAPTFQSERSVCETINMPTRSTGQNVFLFLPTFPTNYKGQYTGPVPHISFLEYSLDTSRQHNNNSITSAHPFLLVIVGRPSSHRSTQLRVAQLRLSHFVEGAVQ